MMISHIHQKSISLNGLANFIVHPLAKSNSVHHRKRLSMAMRYNMNFIYHILIRESFGKESIVFIDFLSEN